MIVAIVAVLAGGFGSFAGAAAALKWGPSGTTESVAGPAAPTPTTLVAASATTTNPEPLPSATTTPSPDGSLAFAPDAAGSSSDPAQWMLQLDPEQPKREGLTIKGSGAQTNYPLFMVRDVNNAPIAWIAPHGGLSLTDNIRVRSGVFKDDGVSMRRWTDNIELTGPGGFSWDGAELVQTTVGEAGSAQPLPGAPELWLRVIDNTGDEPRHLVVPAYLEE